MLSLRRCSAAARQSQSFKTRLTFETLEARELLSGTPPQVTAVHIGSTQWTSAFHDYLAPDAALDLGYRIPTGSAAQGKSLPWFNLDRVSITFSEDVNVKASDLSLSGSNATCLTASHFFYDAFYHVATWTFPTSLTRNTYQIDLDANGVVPVRDVEGNVLDGEWANNSDTFPSGNGIAGGDFAFFFRVLPGDANQNGGVESFDYNTSTTREGLTTTSVNYNRFADVDGNGLHDSSDSEAILGQLSTQYPTGLPAGYSNDAPTSTGADTLKITDASVDAVFSLFGAFQDRETSDNQLTYRIESNSNSALFDVVSINTATGNLIVNAAAGTSGRAEIVVSATDAGGLKTTSTVFVDVNYVNQGPALNYQVVHQGESTFRVFGTVSDDGPLEGLLVEFEGAFNLRASVQADGTFDFSVIVPEENWGEVLAKVADTQHTWSPPVIRSATVS